jgi:hypothetical protein
MGNLEINIGLFFAPEKIDIMVLIEVGKYFLMGGDLKLDLDILHGEIGI